MNRSIATILFCAGTALTALTAHAQSLPSGAPAGTTVECKDGTFAAPEAKSGACSGHKGVKTWFGKNEAKAGAAPTSTEKQSGPAKTGDAPAAVTAKGGKPAATQDPASMTAAPGGGAGKVWVNSSSKVYHCAGDRYYGKTKKGEYMTEAEAKAKGAHADHKKTCGA